MECVLPTSLRLLSVCTPIDVILVQLKLIFYSHNYHVIPSLLLYIAKVQIFPPSIILLTLFLRPQHLLINYSSITFATLLRWHT